MINTVGHLIKSKFNHFPISFLYGKCCLICHVKYTMVTSQSSQRAIMRPTDFKESAHKTDWVKTQPSTGIIIRHSVISYVSTMNTSKSSIPKTSDSFTSPIPLLNYGMQLQNCWHFILFSCSERKRQIYGPPSD